AHLSVAGVMTWLNEFDDLLICDVVPGYQAFTLVDRRRDRVLAATGQAGNTTAASMGVAVTAAWDQFEAAAVRPDAVVLIGSGARAAAVVAAAEGFGAPVIPCRIASAASAVGAALTVTADVARVAEPVERGRSGRGTAVFVAAAGVLVGGLIAGGVYATNAAVVADTRIAADAHGVDASGGSSSGSPAGVSAPPRGSEARGRGFAGR